MIKGIFSALTMVGCFSTIALGFISPRYALAYSCGALLLFVVAIAFLLGVDPKNYKITVVLSDTAPTLSKHYN
jgi:hypothetical protein